MRAVYQVGRSAGTVRAPARRVLRSSCEPAGLGIAQRGKQDHLANRALPGEDHHQPVDPEPEAARGRHPVLQRLEEGLVVRLRLVVGSGRTLGRQARALLDRIVQLAERVGYLDPVAEGLEALDEPRLAAMSLGERRQLDRVVEQERGPDQRRLDVL